MELKYDDKGLIPAIVQDFFTKEVLMMAYMNKESFEITKKEGYTCFYSRSRQELWRKGETSGNRQKVMKISGDCDSDTLLIHVIPDGPACHTGEMSCFFQEILCEKEGFSIDHLADLIADRKKTMPEKSYTTYLFEKGKEKILKKVGEECTEVVVAAMNEDKKETIYEISDVAYHLLVLMAEMGISVNDVRDELGSRHVIDKKVKQEKMT
ncbi:MAG: bifunctional phosphoribosyl-AMP cyclohydrolase/phosphoribosyl-ATP diphosphatase HisIE [Eubacteriales bacterium]